MSPRLRHWLRVRRHSVLSWVGAARLCRAFVRGGVTQVWIGDSHAVTLCTDRFPPLGIGPAGGGRWVWHLGPRLMYSVARDGFAPRIRRRAHVIARAARGRDVTWFFTFGEIDLRCHVAPRVAAGDRLAFVGVYLDRVAALAAETGMARAVVVVPVPPATDALIHEAFPVRGNPQERRVAHGVMRERLHQEVASGRHGPRLAVLDLTDVLSDTTGYFAAELTSDGCHTNAVGRTAAGRVIAPGPPG